MAKSLSRSNREFTPAFEDRRCLACHTTPRSEAVRRETAWLNQDGVGCESCHGAAGAWLGPHTGGEWARRNDASGKREYGFENTKDLANRARICTGCHVGSGPSKTSITRDVTHDLIAAGHPRLDFELSAYLVNEPPHWSEKGEYASRANRLEPAPDFQARAWAIGQLVTARSAASLTAARSIDPKERLA